MTDKELFALMEALRMSANQPDYRWIKLSRHCDATGDTPDAVHARRRKRIWMDGVQCRLGPDGNLYINPEEYNRWVENQPSTARAA